MKPHLVFLLVSTLIVSCQKSEPTYRIGISQCSQDPWRQQMNKEMKREATFYKNVQLDIRSAHDSNELQTRQIDSLLNEGIDLLVVCPNEGRALSPAVEKAMAKGIPVIVADRKTSTQHYTAYIGANNRAIGKDIGAFVIHTLQGDRKSVV